MELTGQVVYPHSPSYSEARADWDALYSSSPRAIVFAETTDDVVNAVTWARLNDVALRVRSGRHHLQGWSNVTDGIVIDVSQLKNVELDPSSGTATLGGGLTQQEVVSALSAHGFAVATGSEGTVGFAGATLGGGFGLLTRSYGMACDNLVGAEVVVPCGAKGAKVVRAEQDENADLLWALRGAGNGNFGVVTSLTCKVRRLSRVSVLEAEWSGYDDLQRVFAAWQELGLTADPRLTTVLDHTVAGPHLIAVLESGSPEEASELLAPIVSVGSPAVSVTVSPWADVFAGFQYPPESSVAQAANWKFFSQFVTEPYSREATDLVARFMQDAPSPVCDYFCLSLGGAVQQSPPGGSSFAHRDALFYAEPGAGWSGTATTPRALEWVAEFSEALRPYVDGAYVNVPNPDMPEWETAYWGDNYPRLREVKEKYDPHDVFRYEQSVSLP